MEGDNFQPKWITVDGTQAACGTCHQGIVDDYEKIIDKTKHMNGKIDVFGN